MWLTVKRSIRLRHVRAEVMSKTTWVAIASFVVLHAKLFSIEMLTLPRTWNCCVNIRNSIGEAFIEDPCHSLIALPRLVGVKSPRIDCCNLANASQLSQLPRRSHQSSTSLRSEQKAWQSLRLYILEKFLLGNRDPKEWVL